MKVTVLIGYILLNLVYLYIGSGRMWGGVQHINQYFLIGNISYWSIKAEKYTRLERYLFFYCIFFTLSISVFTGACIGAYKDWVISYSFWFTTLMGAVFVGLLLYGWHKHKYELGEY